MNRPRILCAWLALPLLVGGCRFVLEIEPAQLLPQDGAADGAAVADAASDAVAACPPEMVLLPGSVCIDRYEASRGDGGVPESVAGRYPWVSLDWSQADAACVAAGKRLCTHLEWLTACRGPGAGTAYPYGDTYSPHACNGDDHGVSALVPTGSLPTCEGGYPGLFDLSGNAWEWNADCTGNDCGGSGGAFEETQTYLGCNSYVESPRATVRFSVGFRCCRSP